MPKNGRFMQIEDTVGQYREINLPKDEQRDWWLLRLSGSTP